MTSPPTDPAHETRSELVHMADLAARLNEVHSTLGAALLSAGPVGREHVRLVIRWPVRQPELTFNLQ